MAKKFLMEHYETEEGRVSAARKVLTERELQRKSVVDAITNENTALATLILNTFEDTYSFAFKSDLTRQTGDYENTHHNINPDSLRLITRAIKACGNTLRFHLSGGGTNSSSDALKEFRVEPPSDAGHLKNTTFYAVDFNNTLQYEGFVQALYAMSSAKLIQKNVADIKSATQATYVALRSLDDNFTTLEFPLIAAKETAKKTLQEALKGAIVEPGQAR